MREIDRKMHDDDDCVVRFTYLHKVPPEFAAYNPTSPYGQLVCGKHVLPVCHDEIGKFTGHPPAMMHECELKLTKSNGVRAFTMVAVCDHCEEQVCDPEDCDRTSYNAGDIKLRLIHNGELIELTEPAHLWAKNNLAFDTPYTLTVEFKNAV